MENNQHPTLDYANTEKFWTELKQEARGLMVQHTLANLANFSALIYHQMPELNWAGFYLREGQQLVLGPFQGRTACVYIDLQRGVCGQAAREGSVQLVADVHAFPGHIACDARSRSELVIPLFDSAGNVWAVFDLDSPQVNRFSASDAEHLQSLINELFPRAEYRVL